MVGANIGNVPWEFQARDGQTSALRSISPGPSRRPWAGASFAIFL